jgi:hypothetical protein
MAKIRSVLVCALALSASVSLARVAVARPDFPGMLKSELNMPCTPQCTVCHLTNAGGFGTLRSITIDGQDVPGFGLKMRDSYGLRIDDVSSLKRALDADAAAGSDVDGDGVPDTVELGAGEDPNDPYPKATLCGASAPIYGCFRVAPPSRLDGFASAASIAALVLGLAALRRSGRPS